MRFATLSLIAAGLSIAAVSTPAAARDYPYCVQGRQTGIPGDCSYATFEQCRASASGRDAFCNVNPRFAFGEQRSRGRGYQQQGYESRAYPPRVRNSYGWSEERY